MNREIETILNALSETPRLLKELITEIDSELYKEEIIKGKWSIHENATHIAVGDIYGFQKRLNDFKQEDKTPDDIGIVVEDIEAQEDSVPKD